MKMSPAVLARKGNEIEEADSGRVLAMLVVHVFA
jgi:hypothetical protein